MNTKVLASASGEVIWNDEDKIFGKTIIIEHLDQYLTLYAHLNKIGVDNGDYVKQGEIIGLTGNTGDSYYPHLHFETIDGNFYYSPLYLNGKSAQLIDFIKSTNVIKSEQTVYKSIGIPSGIGRFDSTGKALIYEDRYKWLTQGDGRVRPSHEEKHGKIFLWSDSPVPQEEHNCRCWAEPVWR